MTSTVLVLNASYEPLQRVSLHHALAMMHRGVAVVHEAADGDLTIGPFVVPKILRLVKYIYAKWKERHSPRWTKSGVFKRDHHTCAYCGKTARTVDHVIPRSQGGTSTWLNTVAACLTCNHRKGSKTLREAGMTLSINPYVPTYEQMHNLGGVFA